VSKSKAKGTAAESAVVSYLRMTGFPYAERLALQGSRDRGDVTGVPGIVFEVKNEVVYTLSSWLAEARTEGDNAQADFAMVIAKPRLVGLPRVGEWYAIMNQGPFDALVRQAFFNDPELLVWTHDMSGANINRDLAKNVKVAQAHAVDARFPYWCVRITPKGVDDPSMYYMVTTLGQMSDLLVRAEYGKVVDGGV
jgi:hypothetical protein